MTRSYDWSVLGLSADPVPGEPGVVRDGGQQYVEVADAIGRAADRLRGLELGVHISEAVDALAENATQIADKISQAQGRYRETGEALLDYAPILARAQEESELAWQSASTARAAEEEASAQRTYYLSLAEGADPEQRVRYENLAESAAGDAAGAARQLDAARAQVDDAVSMRDRAADSAADRIEHTTGGDGLDDSWWDDWGADVLAVVTDVAGWVSTVAGVLAIAVAWIPVVGQALAAALLVVAGVAAVVNAIGNIVLASTGERSWVDAGISILGAALSVVGLGGAARVLGKVAAAGRINSRAAVQAGAKGERLTYRQAVNLSPGDLARSERLWRQSVPDLSRGDAVYRLHGGASGRTGASWSSVDPHTLANPRQQLGLPDVNTAERLIVARLDDPGAVVLQRHALPLDGMPGGAPEYILPGGVDSPALTELSDTVFRLP
ncbi:hypothetical protein [Georgenia daeguensis]|uniref:Uncharacterized protein n=1 Tax=Georgenia daeguensis TaxID=908355 RepID=A0ABP8EVB4_9MICO